MKKVVRVILITVVFLGFSLKNGQAIVVPSALLESEENKKAPIDQQRLKNIVKKLEHHGEENIHFLGEIQNELKEAGHES